MIISTFVIHLNILKNYLSAIFQLRCDVCVIFTQFSTSFELPSSSNEMR